MNWRRSTAAHLPVRPDAAWEVLVDVARWPQWEPTVRRAWLTGRHFTSRVLDEAGSAFRHPDIDSALAEILG